jgi:hypothetical protein
VAAGAATGVPLSVGAPDRGFITLANAAEPVSGYDWTKYPPSRQGHAEFRVVDGDYFTRCEFH